MLTRGRRCAAVGAHIRISEGKGAERQGRRCAAGGGKGMLVRLRIYANARMKVRYRGSGGVVEGGGRCATAVEEVR